MKISGRQFAPPWWAWVITVPACAALAVPGFWQLDRATQKQKLLAAYAEAARQPPMALTADTPAPPVVMAAQARGRYLPERQLLLDNQSSHGQPGYNVWTPLVLEGGGLVLVNRGWVPLNPDRRVLPDVAVPAEPVTVTGIWRALPRPALRLAAGNCAASAWPRVVQYPTVDNLHCLYPDRIAPGILLLAPEEPYGYVREWTAAEFPPERHYAYAAQWFGLSMTLFVIFIVVNLKRIP